MQHEQPRANQVHAGGLSWTMVRLDLGSLRFAHGIPLGTFNHPLLQEITCFFRHDRIAVLGIPPPKITLFPITWLSSISVLPICHLPCVCCTLNLFFSNHSKSFFFVHLLYHQQNKLITHSQHDVWYPITLYDSKRRKETEWIGWTRSLLSRLSWHSSISSKSSDQLFHLFR